MSWLDRVVMSWVRSIHSSTAFSTPPSAQVVPTFSPPYNPRMDECRQKLLQYLYETYTKARIEQLFNIIIEFPESQPALEDLRRVVNIRKLKTKN